MDGIKTILKLIAIILGALVLLAGIGLKKEREVIRHLSFLFAN